MRTKRTPDENWAIKELLNHYKDEELVEDESITDSPDLVASNDLKRIGCEITNIALPEMFKWRNDVRNRAGNDELEICMIPREPNEWLREVLESKNPKVEKYKANAESNEIWLLIHSSDKAHDPLFTNKDKYDMALLKYAANKIPHAFDKILVLSANTGIHQVFPSEIPYNDLPEKLQVAKLMRVTLQSLKAEVRKVDFNQTPAREIWLDPIGEYEVVTNNLGKGEGKFIYK